MFRFSISTLLVCLLVVAFGLAIAFNIPPDLGFVAAFALGVFSVANSIALIVYGSQRCRAFGVGALSALLLTWATMMTELIYVMDTVFLNGIGLLIIIGSGCCTTVIQQLAMPASAEDQPPKRDLLWEVLLGVIIGVALIGLFTTIFFYPDLPANNDQPYQATGGII